MGVAAAAGPHGKGADRIWADYLAAKLVLLDHQIDRWEAVEAGNAEFGSVARPPGVMAGATATKLAVLL